MAISDSIIQNLDRDKRQLEIDADTLEPLWSQNVDVNLIEMSLSSLNTLNPVILLPELRYRSLLSNTVLSFPRSSKFMVVDKTNRRFDQLRSILPEGSNVYFSTQNLNALSYSVDVFDSLLCSFGLLTTTQTSLILPEYRRVLKPGGKMAVSFPVQGTLTPFFDLLHECLLKLMRADADAIMDKISLHMDDNRILREMEQIGLHVVDFEIETFSIAYASVERFLFSSLMESSFLPVCLFLFHPNAAAGKELISLLVRAFHHYYQGLSFDANMRIACVCAQKPETAG